MIKPTTRVYRALILEALKQGEGTARDLIERIGGEPPGGCSAVSHWLRTMARQGRVQSAGLKRYARGGPATIWALPEPQTEEAA